MGTVKHVDADALADARSREWARLDELSRQSLDGAGVDELITRYRAASADLADLRSSVGSSPQSAYVSTILARARLRLTGQGENVLRQTGRFFTRQLPAALYRLRWTTLVIALASLVVIVGVAIWITSDPALVAALGSKADLTYYAEHSFTDYYTENPAAEFAGMVWTNNAWIAAQCVLLGVTGIWPIMVLMQNAVNVGLAVGIMFAFGRGDVVVLYLLPHGMLELTCIFVAAAAGLHIFWAWLVPGERTRGEALAAAGRSLGTVAIGLVFALGLSGLVEGFVTGWGLPWPVKIGIGALALAVFLGYMLIVGRRAQRLGESGDLAEFEAGTPTLVSG